MSRTAHPAQEIQAEVSRRIHDGDLVKADRAQIAVPLPTPYATGVVEPNGSNWTMSAFGNAVGYEEWIVHCLTSVQSEWDLASED